MPDFLDLLAERGALAPGRAGEGTVAAGGYVGTEATTVFAFRCRAGVMVAGDRRATAGNLIVTDTADKLIELDGHSVLAVAGVPAVAFEMARTLQTSFEYYRRSQLQPMSLPAKLRSVTRLLRDNLGLTLQGVGVVMPIFVGVDVLGGSDRAEIYFYDPLGAQFQDVLFAASGSGSGTVRSVLGYLDRFGEPPPRELELDAAIRLSLRLLAVAAEFDSATGGVKVADGRFATLKLVTGQGVRTIAAEKQTAVMGG